MAANLQKRCASMDLPEPGGPTSSTPWLPAAAISSARRAAAWPFTSAKSGPSGTVLGRVVGCRRCQPLLGTAASSGVRAEIAAPRPAGVRRGTPWHQAPVRPLQRCPAAAPCAWWQQRVPLCRASAVARAPRTAQLARQRQLARKFPARELRRVHLPAGCQNAQGDRQVEAARSLWADRPVPG